MKLKKFYLYLSVPFIFLLLWVFLFYLPLQSKIELTRKKLAETKKERERIEKELEYFLQLTKKGKEVESTLKELRSKIPDVGESVVFLKEMVSEARKKGVRVETITSLFTSLKSLEGKRFAYPVFEVTMKGRFLDMGKFLEGLNEKEAISNIIKGKIYLNEKEYPDVVGKITLEMRAFKEGI